MPKFDQKMTIFKRVFNQFSPAAEKYVKMFKFCLIVQLWRAMYVFQGVSLWSGELWVRFKYLSYLLLTPATVI